MSAIDIQERVHGSLAGWKSYFQGRGKMFWAAAAMVVLYVYLIVFPFLAVIAASFTAHGSSFVGPVTLANWTELYEIGKPLIANTLGYSIGTALLTTVIAVVLSWSIARTNIPFAKGYYNLAFLGFFFPPVAWEILWIRLIGYNGLYAKLLGVDSLHVGSLLGMVVVASIRFLPLAVVMLIPLFASIDKSMEDAGRISGTGILHTTWNITVPLVAPGILSVFLLVFMISLGAFRVPLLIGLPNGIMVLSTAIYEQVLVSPVNYGVGMAEASALFVLTIPLLYLYKRSLGKTQQYATISGRGYERNPIDIGRWRYVLAGVLSLFFLITMVVPLGLLVYSSLLNYYIPPLSSAASLSTFTLDAYRSVFAHEFVITGLRTSLLVALVATSLAVVGAIVSAWIVQKTDIPFRGVVDYLSFAMIGLPSIALAVGLIFVYLKYVPGGTIIYGSIAILVVAMYTRYISATVKVIEPGVIQIKRELLESAEIAGVSLLSRFRNIVLPLIKGSAQAAWSMRFAIIFLEFPLAVMLQTQGNQMVSVALYRLQSSGSFTQVAALSVVIMAILGAITAIAHRV